MSRKDAVTLASRTLALLMVVFALVDLSYLPGRLNSFVHYAYQFTNPTDLILYQRHYYLIELGFLIVRVIGLSLLARWLFNGGPEIEQLFLPEEQQDVEQV